MRGGGAGGRQWGGIVYAGHLGPAPGPCPAGFLDPGEAISPEPELTSHPAWPAQSRQVVTVVLAGCGNTPARQDLTGRARIARTGSG